MWNWNCKFKCFPKVLTSAKPPFRHARFLQTKFAIEGHRKEQLVLSFDNAIMWHKHAKETRKKKEKERKYFGLTFSHLSSTGTMFGRISWLLDKSNVNRILGFPIKIFRVLSTRNIEQLRIVSSIPYFLRKATSNQHGCSLLDINSRVQK